MAPMAARAESASTSESRSTRQRRSNDRLLEFRKRKEQQAAALVRLQRFVAAGRLQLRIRRWLAGRKLAAEAPPKTTEGVAEPEPGPHKTAAGSPPAAAKRKACFAAAASLPKRAGVRAAAHTWAQVAARAAVKRPVGEGAEQMPNKLRGAPDDNPFTRRVILIHHPLRGR